MLNLYRSMSRYWGMKIMGGRVRLVNYPPPTPFGRCPCGSTGDVTITFSLLFSLLSSLYRQNEKNLGEVYRECPLCTDFAIDASYPRGSEDSSFSEESALTTVTGVSLVPYRIFY